MVDGLDQEPSKAEKLFDDLRIALNKDLAEIEVGAAYHYTTTQVAQTIISTRKLWATEVAFLNDPTEWAHCHELFAAELKSRCKPQMRSEVREVLEFLARRILKRIDRKFLVLVASLCEDSDDLALWRPYAADGAGCCIGIDLAKIRGNGEVGGAGTARMIYKDNEKAQRTAQSVTEHLRLADQMRASGHPPKTALEQMIWSLEVQASLLATTFKHRAYRAEREWRLVEMAIEGGWAHGPVQYRVTGSGVLAPYVEVDVAAAISEVVVGPRQPPAAVDGWNSWLKSAGRENIKVRRSEAPYRGAT